MMAQPVFCKSCGKPLSAANAIEAGVGHTCAKPSQQPEVVAARKAKYYIWKIPQGYVKLSLISAKIKETKLPGLGVSKFVKAFGYDTNRVPPAHISLTPLYLGNVRYLPDFYLTKEGLRCLQTGDYTKLPKTLVSDEQSLVALVKAHQ